MTDEEIASNIQWEAEQYIPFDVNEVNLDFQILTANPEEGQMDVLLVAACTGDSLPERLRPSDVWVLRHAKRITLARIQHGGPRGGVLLLPTRESRGDVERVPSRAVIGRVVAAIRT